MKKLIVVPLLFISGLLMAQANKKFCEQIIRLGDIASHDSLSSLQGKPSGEDDTQFASLFKLPGALSATISLNEFGENPTADFRMKDYGTDSAKAIGEFEKMARQVQDCLLPGKVEDVMKVPGQPQTKRFFYYKKAMIVVETYKIFRTGQWICTISAWNR